MKSFSNFKRDIRTLYKPKSKVKRHDESQGLGNDATQAPCDGPSMQLESVPSTRVHPDDTQKIADISYAEPAEDTIVKGRTTPVGYEQDAPSSIVVSPHSNDPDVDTISTSTPSPTVRKWLSKVPEGGEAESVGEETHMEADEWDAEEVGISDSVSLVGEGRQRSKIDRWQDACLAEKSQ